MLIFLIAVGIVVGVIIGGALLAGAVAQFDRVVTENYAVLDEKDKSYNPALTLGFDIKANADAALQVKEARKVAAKQAAAKPRGANMGIGRLGNSSELRTAFAGVKDDPITAAKIAAIYGWDGVRTGPTATAAAAAPVAATAAPATGGKIKLVPGKDYPVVEITDDMSPADKRKARIANAKAKSKAMKAAKEAGVPAQAAAPVAAPVAAAAAAAPAAPAAAAGIPEPNYIEISDGMPPDELRKARIHNAKERSKYNKALKAAGVDPKAAAAGAAVPATAPAAAPAAAPATAAPAAPDLSGIPEPNYIEITDGMSPDELRKARINNAKERSKYNKALKAAGIDPKSVQA